MSPQRPSGVGDAPRCRGPTAGAPRLAAPARVLRAQTAPLREKPAEKKGRTRRPTPRALTRLPRAHRRARSARSDALTLRAPTAHLRRARVLPARRRAHPAHSVRTHATRDTRHHSHILCVTDTLLTVGHLCGQSHLALNGRTGTTRRRCTVQQAGTKSARVPAYKPRIYRGSNVGFVPPSVYICFFSCLQKRRGNLCPIPWRARRTAGFWAMRLVGILFCPAPLRPAASPCAAPTRNARGMFGFWARQIFSLSRIHLSSPKNSAVIAPSPPKSSPPDGLKMMPASFLEKA